MLHRVSLTPTQRAARDVRTKLLSLQPKPRPIPIQQQSPVTQSVPVTWVPIVPTERHPEPVEPRKVMMADIVAEVCRYYEQTRDALYSERKDAKLARARQVAMYFGRWTANRTTPEVGMMLGGRDHTTVLHGSRKIARLLQEGDKATVDDIDLLTARIMARVNSQPC
jgi:hypothetical protein